MSLWRDNPRCEVCWYGCVLCIQLWSQLPCDWTCFDPRIWTARLVQCIQRWWPVNVSVTDTSYLSHPCQLVGKCVLDWCLCKPAPADILELTKWVCHKYLKGSSLLSKINNLFFTAFCKCHTNDCRKRLDDEDGYVSMQNDEIVNRIVCLCIYQTKEEM